MIVKLRLEISDGQRNALSRRLNPRAAKRLASREEVTRFVLAAVAELNSTPASGIAKVEKRDPEPFGEAAPVDNLPVSVDNPAETPIEPLSGQGASADNGAPQDRLRAAIFHVNNALFVMRRGMFHELPEAHKLYEAALDARERLVEIHDDRAPA